MPAQAPCTASDLAEPLAKTFAQIMRALIALIARAFVRHPLLTLRMVACCNHLNRAAQRFARLMARIATGRYRARPRATRPAAPRPPQPPSRQPPNPRLPARKAWLLHTMRDHPLRHEAAIVGGHLAQCLGQPGVAEFLAAHPAAQRILNPVRHFLGLPTTRKPRIPQPPSGTQPSGTQPPGTQPSGAQPPPKPRTPRPRSWTQILADDAARHPRPALRKKT